MLSTLKTYFIPHAENDFHPHILHTKRVVIYGAVGLVIKLMVFVFVLTLPLGAFMAPDVVREQAESIIALTNKIRQQKNLPPLTIAPGLALSAQRKAESMARGNYFSHVSPDGKTVETWIEEAEYDYDSAGENLAMGFSSAENVMAAWLKSPTHYANLIDKDFKNFGIGIQSGDYDGVPTVFIVQHFGTQRTSTKEKIPQKQAEKPTSANKSKGVAGIRIEKRHEKSTLKVNRQKSRVDWNKQDNNTALAITAEISGPVQTVIAHIDNYPIELQSVGGETYRGALVVPEPPDELFRTIIEPAITLTSTDGKTINDTLHWSTLKVFSASPLEKYFFAQGSRSSFTNIFSVSRWVYGVLIAVFFLAFLLNIFIEIRKQHPRVIIQTACLITLLIFFFRI